MHIDATAHPHPSMNLIHAIHLANKSRIKRKKKREEKVTISLLGHIGYAVQGETDLDLCHLLHEMEGCILLHCRRLFWNVDRDWDHPVPSHPIPSLLKRVVEQKQQKQQYYASKRRKLAVAVVCYCHKVCVLCSGVVKLRLK